MSVREEEALEELRSRLREWQLARLHDAPGVAYLKKLAVDNASFKLNSILLGFEPAAVPPARKTQGLWS